MRKKIIKISGFTLVEMLLYMGLLSMFLVVLTGIFFSIIDVQLSSQATSVVQQDGQYLLVKLAADIQRADSITTPLNLGDTSTSLDLVISGVNHNYALNNGRLELTDDMGSYSMSSDGVSVSQLSFQRLGNVGGINTIKFGFTMDQTGTRTRNFQTTIGLR